MTQRSPRRFARFALLGGSLLLVVLVVSLLFARGWLRHSAEAALPQIDGSLHVAGLSAPVTVERDAHGVPHLRAANIDDLILAQGYVTAQDRLFQMDLLRRHAAGELAEVLGPALLEHDRMQRTLQIRAAADNALSHLPARQLHLMERYAAGVNASMTEQLADHAAHLPLNFKLLGSRPAPWTARDCLLVSLVLYEDLTNAYPEKLARELVSRKLSEGRPPDEAAALLHDLYPVGSWRDHPPTDPVKDLTVDGPPMEQIPLDESQSSLHAPAPASALPRPVAMLATATQLRDLNAQIAPYLHPAAACADCRPGSNNWAVSGAHTASGKPMLSNDMHLAMSVPGVWYEADLEAPGEAGGEPFHVAGVTIPGLPLVVVGHNQHIAWGFTNLGGDVQDVYIETLRGDPGHEEFRATDGSWQPLVHLPERIHVKGRVDTVLDVRATRHGGTLSPLLGPALTDDKRPLALRWTLYDASILKVPFFEVDSAHDWPSFLAAFSTFGGPSQNVVYADDAGHIGYHAIGAIPLRGAAGLTTVAAAPADDAAADAPVALNTSMSGPLPSVPVVPSAATEWSGYIPFDRLPQIFDPPGGVVATANARVTPNDYPFPITLSWASPYRNERIWHLLAHRNDLKSTDMLAIQTDISSAFDQALAQRLAYALDHSSALAGGHYKGKETTTLRQAANLLRVFNGRMATDSAAASIVSTVHHALWGELLAARLHVTAKGLDAQAAAVNSLYQWGERDYALEEILLHQPQRWLPAGYGNWNDFLTDATARALAEAHAPGDLAKWQYGSIHTLEVSDAVLGRSPAVRTLLGMRTGTGEQPLSGDSDTVKQVGHAFGPSERLTVDLADPDHTTLNLTMGQSGDPASPFYLDQFPAWMTGRTFAFAFSDAAAKAAAVHTLTLNP